MNKDLFSNPRNYTDLDQCESPLWFWNDKLDNEEIRRQLKLMTEIGVTCNMPHGRMGYIGEYLGEEWMGNIRTVLEYKKEANEPVWLYDEFAWPAGTCNRTVTKDENLREQYLSFRKILVPANEPFRSGVRPITGFQYGADLTKTPVNTFIYDEETEERLDITPMLKLNQIGAMEVYDFELLRGRNSIVYVVSLHSDNYDLGGSEMVSYINKEATKKFLELTYDRYYTEFQEYFGNTLTAFFNDETRMGHSFVWSSDFAEEFEKRKGYDIRYHLAELIIPGPKAGRIRCDYYDVVASLYQENYLGEIKKWCDDHKVAICAHLLGEETLAGQARFSGDYMRQLKSMTWPGIDHLGKGIGSLNAKFGASAAHSYGKENYNVEIFAGCGWDMTFEEYIRMISWMYQQGVQIIINHGFFYSDREFRAQDWPPSQFFQWKEWPKMKKGNDMIRRLYHAFTGGRHEAEVLIYNPIESFWLYYIGNEGYLTAYSEGPLVEDKRAEFIDREAQRLYTGLLEKNIDFDIFHNDAMENYSIENGEFVNKLNGEHFKIFILPMCEVLSIEFVKQLQNFAKQGGKIIALDCLPKYAMPKEKDGELSEIIESMLQEGQIELMENIEDLSALIKKIDDIAPQPVKIIEGKDFNVNNHRNYPNWVVDPYFHEGEDLDGIAYSRYLKDGYRQSYFVNFGKEEERVIIKTESTGKPEIWDSMTGEIYEPDIILKVGIEYTIKVILPVGYGIFLVTKL